MHDLRWRRQDGVKVVQAFGNLGLQAMNGIWSNGVQQSCNWHCSPGFVVKVDGHSLARLVRQQIWWIVECKVSENNVEQVERF